MQTSSSVMEEHKYDDPSRHFLRAEKRMKVRKKSRHSRKMKAPKFRSFKAPRHVSRKVKDLKDLKELRLVTSLSNSFKKLGNHKPVKLSPFTYKPNMRNTRLRPRFKQQKTTRARRASSALVIRAELEEIFAGKRYRSSSYDVANSEGGDEGEEEEDGAKEDADEIETENNSSFDSLNEYISEEGQDVVAPLQATSKLSPGSNRRLLKTSSGSGVYFADGYFETTLRRREGSIDIGLTLEEFRSASASLDAAPTLMIVKVAAELYGKHGNQIPPGTITVGDQLVRVNNIQVHSLADVYRILQESLRTEVDLGVKHGAGFMESKQDDAHEELSSSSGATSPDNSPYTDGVDVDESEWFDAEMDSNRLDRDVREGQHLVLKMLPDRVHSLTSNGEDITYSKIQEDISAILQVPLEGDDWRLWFTSQLDQLCESGLFTVLGMDMETMSPVLSRVL